MTDKEVMQQALEALESVYLSLQLPDLLKVVGPITALREALAQPEQEPDRRALQAAGTHPAPCARHCESKAYEIEIRSLKSALRRALEQPEQVDCPECKAAVLYECVACSSNNYPPKPEQEPVAWQYKTVEANIYVSEHRPVDVSVWQEIEWSKPLYTTPPAAQRQWVGLTPEEILDLFDRNNVYGSKWIEFARTVEARLKERNT